jgi:hypothetical protein
MKTNEAKEITGSLSKPSKMPGFAYTIDIKIINTPKLADSSIIFYTPFSTSHLVLIYYLTPKVFGHSVVPL